MAPTLTTGRHPATPGTAPPTPTYSAWIDALLLIGLAALIGGVAALARRWNAPLRPTVEIDLSAWALPGYTALSLARGVAAYLISLVVTLVYGTVAAHSRRAERVMIPLIDILQGIPVLGFLPGLVLGLVALFPHSNLGLEPASAAMIFMIVAVDQVVWRPALAWAQKFKVEETAATDVPRSLVLDLLRRSRILDWFGRQTARLSGRVSRHPALGGTADGEGMRRRLARGGGWAVAGSALLFAGWGAAHQVRLVTELGGHEWLTLAGALGLTFLRTTVALVVGALWTVPAGVWIGISPRRSRLLQQPVQVAAAFPAPMLYPLVTIGLLAARVPFSWGCTALMLLGAQWYIPFNVLAGASALPPDLREAAETYGLGGWTRWRTLYLPAVFPHLVTGLITAAGGAWNASIVAEYV